MCQVIFYWWDGHWEFEVHCYKTIMTLPLFSEQYIKVFWQANWRSFPQSLRTDLLWLLGQELHKVSGKVTLGRVLSDWIQHRHRKDRDLLSSICPFLPFRILKAYFFFAHLENPFWIHFIAGLFLFGFLSAVFPSECHISSLPFCPCSSSTWSWGISIRVLVPIPSPARRLHLAIDAQQSSHMSVSPTAFSQVLLTNLCLCSECPLLLSCPEIPFVPELTSGLKILFHSHL